MDKTLIVYFSLEGNTRYVAEELRVGIGADVLELVPKKEYPNKGFKKFFWGGKSAVMAETPALEPYAINMDDYERIVFGFPVWASNFAPPLRTFIKNTPVLATKKIAAFACQSGAGAEKALEKLKECIGIKEFEATLVLIDPLTNYDYKQGDMLVAFIKKLNEEKEQQKSAEYETKKSELEKIKESVKDRPSVTINQEFYGYLYTCKECNNEILIKTNEGRYGNLGPFNCPVCNAHYYATIDDGGPTPFLYVAKYGEQPASLLDIEGQKRSEKIPLLYQELVET